jgi:hypothetical protein
VIYIATVHVGSARWIDIQLSFLTRNLAEPFAVYANLEDVPNGYTDRFAGVVHAGGQHAGKLNLLAAEIASVASPDDIIIFLDGDAFPIADPMPVVRAALEHSTLVAVRRDENATDRQPHPSFCAIRVCDWQRLQGDWSPGHCWTTEAGRSVTDVGGNLLRALERAGDTWTPLLRTNRVDLHPLWFGIYGGIVYHHGAGFRWAVGRVDLADIPRIHTRAKHLPVVGPTLRYLNRSRAQRFHARTAAEAGRLRDEVLAKIEQDPEFYRQLL